jgi:hypothetical protein
MRNKASHHIAADSSHLIRELHLNQAFITAGGDIKYNLLSTVQFAKVKKFGELKSLNEV